MSSYIAKGMAHRLSKARLPATQIPWWIWCCVVAVVSGAVGAVWDVSWHKSIGRDTFWTPAHVLIYLCAVIAGLSCAWLIASITFSGSSPYRGSSVRIWGMRGPLGAFVCGWGSLAMLTSAPFDNWWHNAYGLDVKILSPPHILLVLGMMTIRVGALIMIIGEMNRAAGVLRSRLQVLALCIFALLLAIAVGVFQEFTLRNYMHSAQFYCLISLGAPLVLGAVIRSSEPRWSCSKVLLLYMGFYLSFVWMLPFFPAEPKLGPVYQRVTHFLPPDFPLLLIVPACAIDLLRARIAAWSKWPQAAILGALFLATFIAVQWPFAEFLMSAASRNRFFATADFPFFVPPTTDWVRNVFTHVERSPQEFWTKMILALGLAILTTRGGLACGDWMRRIRR